MKNNKILFLLQLPPPIHGASLRNKSIAESKNLNEKYNIKVLNLSINKNLETIGDFSLIKLLKTKFIGLKLLFNLIFFKPKFVYYVFSPYGFAFYRDVLFAFIINLSGKKILFHMREKGILNESKKSRFKRFLYKKTFKNNNIICITELVKNDLKTVYEKKPYIVADGVEEVITENRFMKKQYNDIPVIIFLSNLTISKGIYDFIESLKILKEEEIEFKGVIVGAPHEISKQELLTYIKEKNLDNFIEYKGPLYGKDKFDQIFESDIFVFPTYYKSETFGIVIIEAMQAGLPVVSTDEGSIKSIVKDGINGFIVKKRSPESIADKLILLVSDKRVRQKMGKKGRELYLKNYRIDIVIEKMINLFEDLLED